MVIDAPKILNTRHKKRENKFPFLIYDLAM
jgi:hypothetical protein